MTRVGRLAAVLGAAAAILVLGAAPAFADAAGPTDYESSVVSIEPDVDGITIAIIGGDSFVELTSARNDVVEVVGYRGEPYLRFLPGGIVEQNSMAPSTYLNIDRYADVELPPGVTPEADPVWEQVADSGRYAWHDHRMHWMNASRPPGKQPGDEIAGGVIPLLVAGSEVDVSLVSVWLPAPSALPVVIGALLGIGAGLAAWRGGFRRAAEVTTILALLVLIVGVVAYLSVPPETGPSPFLWVIPVTSLALAIGARFLDERGSGAFLLLLIASLELVAWSVVGWDWMWRAILPTEVPFWAHRLVTAAALTGGAVAAASLIASRLRTVKPAPA